MAANKISFKKLGVHISSGELYGLCELLLPLAKDEFFLFVDKGNTLEDKVKEAFLSLDEKYLISNKFGPLSVAGRKKIQNEGIRISCLFVTTTQLITKYIRDYIVAARMFLSKMAEDSDILVLSYPADYKKTENMASKFGFKPIAETNHRGHKIVTTMLRCKEWRG